MENIELTSTERKQLVSYLTSHISYMLRRIEYAEPCMTTEERNEAWASVADLSKLKDKLQA
jgi:hypothetical protein